LRHNNAEQIIHNTAEESMADPTDQILVEDTLRGNEHAFAELVRRYQTAIWRTVRSRLQDHFASEDAVQEVFLRAFASLHKFDSSRPFDHWLMRIATNYCIDVLRHRRIEQAWLFHHLQEAGKDSSWYPPQQHALLDVSELKRITGSLLGAVQPGNRNAFVLREIEGFEYDEIAKTLRITPLAARARVFRARREMKIKLRNQFPMACQAMTC
jgi:RNA polymerase sigma factor (sigma-70 family)